MHFWHWILYFEFMPVLGFRYPDISRKLVYKLGKVSSQNNIFIMNVIKNVGSSISHEKTPGLRGF